MLEYRVLIQFVLYLVSFYITWPILMAGFINPFIYDFPFWVVLTFVAPLQGFNNALVYGCPRFLLKDKRLIRLRASIIDHTAALRGAGSKFMQRVSSRSSNVQHTETSSGDVGDADVFEEIHASDTSSPDLVIDPSVAIATECGVPPNQ